MPMGLLRPFQEPLRKVVHDGGLRKPHEGPSLSATSGFWQRSFTPGAKRKKVMAVVDLMNLEDQVDLDFTVARRRARLGRLKRRLLRQAARSTLLSPGHLRRSVPASGAMYRGRRTLEVSRIVGSVGKHEHFDSNFMPLSK